MLNIHPSLLPKYKGLNTHQRALDAGDMVAGCTVHLVDAGVDSGAILAQAEVPILADDDGPTLHARIQEQEHRLFPKTIGEYGQRVLEDGGSEVA